MNSLRVQALIFSAAAVAAVLLLAFGIIARDLVAFATGGLYAFGAFCESLPRIAARAGGRAPAVAAQREQA